MTWSLRPRAARECPPAGSVEGGREVAIDLILEGIGFAGYGSSPLVVTLPKER
jgi:hypothetical protein